MAKRLVLEKDAMTVVQAVQESANKKLKAAEKIFNEEKDKMTYDLKRVTKTALDYKKECEELKKKIDDQNNNNFVGDLNKTLDDIINGLYNISIQKYEQDESIKLLYKN